MTHSTPLEPSPAESAKKPQNTQATKLWPLFLCSVLWAAVSFGCATVTYVTEVVPKITGLGANVSMQIEYDPAVYAAMQESDSNLPAGIAASQGDAGWTVKQSNQGETLLMRRNFATVAELETIPQILAGNDGDPKDSFIQSTGVVTKLLNENEIEYVFTATVVVAPSENDSQLPEDAAEDPYSMKNLLKNDPKLLAAIEQAGPAKIVIQTSLPGTIVEATVDGVEGGDQLDSKVRWQFSQDKPGTYQVRAVSHGPTTAATEEMIGDLFNGDEQIQTLVTAIGLDDMMEAMAKDEAMSVVEQVRKAQGRDPYDKVETLTDHLILQTAFFAALCSPAEINPICLMPTVYRVMPLIKRLAVYGKDDEDAAAALSLFVSQLVQHDLKDLEAKTN